jgi:hypothetical protein
MRKKLRRVKRLAFLGVLIGAVVVLRRAATRRDARNVLGPPASWPPLQPGEPPVGAVGELAAEPVAMQAAAASDEAAVASDEPVAAVGDIAAEQPGAAWLRSDDGSCPSSHPVKVNATSGIYHLPGGPHYSRTRAERWYVDAAAAEADGYRAAKSSDPGGPTP